MVLAAIAILSVADLPVGSAPEPVKLPHFPSRLHAVVWRNWPLVPVERIARTVGATPAQIRRLGSAMGLPPPSRISADAQRRSYLTVIRRNWHLLPYDQLLTLLSWTEEQLAFTLREDDFLYIKLGSHKPKCEPVRYTESDAPARKREAEISAIVRSTFGPDAGRSRDPLFSFVRSLSAPQDAPRSGGEQNPGGVRFCYSYFALYGDPLLDREADPYPDGYLARLAQSGVTGVWLQGVLHKLTPFPWDPARSEGWAERQSRLRALVARAKKHGIGVYLYLNEPRAMPLGFFESRPHLKGVSEGEFAALCTSVPEVREFLTASVDSMCRAAPDLAGVFTITASENLTSCWSHGRGSECVRCKSRAPQAVIAEVNAAIQAGIRRSGAATRLIAWDWGWADAWAEDVIRSLPPGVALQSVSEWSLPIRRGGVDTEVGEYSVSVVGPGPRARKHWEAARSRGLPVFAKIQAANSWELSSLPYLPVLWNTARHAWNLRQQGVDGIMLGWTLGGYPSPNIEVVREVISAGRTPEEALERVAARRYGAESSGAVVRFWQACSEAMSEFPFHIGTVYTAPMQFGPSNLLWETRTGYAATMVGFPYDDLDTWRSVYPPDVFASQLAKVSDGFQAAAGQLRRSMPGNRLIDSEARLAEAAAIHFGSAADQSRFVRARDALAAAKDPDAASRIRQELQQILDREIDSALRLYRLQREDSRIGFEASNHYYYVPLDLVEKVLCCRDLRDRWLAQR